MRVATAGTSSPAHLPAMAPRAPRVVWRFESASPLTGPPALGPDGRVVITSVEGAVHALEADGRLRWSHGLTGVPLGAPSVDSEGQVYVATSAQRLYALRSDGRLRWVHRARSRVAAPPLASTADAIFFVGRDQGLYEVSGSGNGPERRPLGAAAQTGLSFPGPGQVALGTAEGAVVFERGAPPVRIGLEGGLLQPLLGVAGVWLALTPEGLTALDAATSAALWRAPAQRAALSADGRHLLVESRREVTWRSPETGEERHYMWLSAEATAPPGVTNAGVAVVPLISGDVWLGEPTTGRAATLAIARAPVRAPVMDESRGRCLVVSGRALVALDIAGWEQVAADAEAKAVSSGASPSPPAVEAAPSGSGA